MVKELSGCKTKRFINSLNVFRLLSYGQRLQPDNLSVSCVIIEIERGNCQRLI